MEDDREVAQLASSASELPIKEDNIPSKQPRKRFVGRKAVAQKNGTSRDSTDDIESSGAVQTAKSRRTARTLNQIPDNILQDPDINAAISLLPPNYNFEIHKTIHRIRSSNARCIALQFPEGLLLFATTISDILTRFCPGITTLIMGDVTYGACCIDDYTACALGCDLLVHYAHSCLVPVAVTKIATLYVFVTIGIDEEHLIATVIRNFKPGECIALVGTVQFNAAIHSIAQRLRHEGFDIVVPQITPLSKGEILGCTAPAMPTKGMQDVLSGNLNQVDKRTGKIQSMPDLLLYVGDGRFHLESAQIANPKLRSYKYDPYTRRLTHETFSHDELYKSRSAAVLSARRTLSVTSPSSESQTNTLNHPKWGIILGALGRQGNPHTLTLIDACLQRRGIPLIKLLLSEIFPGKLALMPDVGVWVQIACPRLSIDWGDAFPAPLLSPYEALVALGEREADWLLQDEDDKDAKRRDVRYPMDFYGKDGLGRTSRAAAEEAKRRIEIEIEP